MHLVSKSNEKLEKSSESARLPSLVHLFRKVCTIPMKTLVYNSQHTIISKTSHPMVKVPHLTPKKNPKKSPICKPPTHVIFKFLHSQPFPPQGSYTDPLPLRSSWSPFQARTVLIPSLQFGASQLFDPVQDLCWSEAASFLEVQVLA